MNEAEPHKDFNTDEDPPPGLSREDYAMRLVMFWHRYTPEFRAATIRHLESQPNYWCDSSLGLVVTILRGIEKIGPPPRSPDPRDEGNML